MVFGFSVDFLSNAYRKAHRHTPIRVDEWFDVESTAHLLPDVGTILDP